MGVTAQVGHPAARWAPQVGFDSVWIADTIVVHPDRSSSTGSWDRCSILAAIAAHTTRIELGSLVTGGGFRNPVLLAHVVNTVDQISGGRAVLGVGAGEKGLRASLGLSPEGRYGRLEESVAVVRGLLRDGQIHDEGCFLTVDAERPLRGPRPTDHARHLSLSGAADARDGCALRRRLERVAGLRRQLPEQARCGASGAPPHVRSWDITDAALRGSPEDVAEPPGRFAAMGISPVQVYLGHITAEDVDAFAPVLEHLGDRPVTNGPACDAAPDNHEAHSMAGESRPCCRRLHRHAPLRPPASAASPAPRPGHAGRARKIGGPGDRPPATIGSVPTSR